MRKFFASFSTRLEKVFSNFILKLVHCRQFFLSRSMQRRVSIGATTKIPRLSTGTTRKFKTRQHSRKQLAAFPTFLLTKQRLKVKLVFQ